MLDFLEIYYYCTVECNLASSVFHFFIDPLFSCTLLYKYDFCQKIQFQSNFSFDAGGGNVPPQGPGAEKKLIPISKVFLYQKRRWRGQPLQDRKPLPEAEKTEGERHRPAGATFTRSKATARGREEGGDVTGRRGQPLTRSESHCPGSRRWSWGDIGRRGQPLTRTKSHCLGP